ncbi:hypothetical protein DQM68_05295 [Leptospira mayottensis]|uniref:Uncharacterized protein n=2 Tax=Leptospira mayottensis TaxID=1137606 RepID=A0AA87SZ02_9LEPT|nr:hypothetical protein DQM68_05295 [Leptospira mayottensis]AZQ03367.1 hypothetical protein LEP1GSC190_16450 [Leptospira mayottensis 200901116]EKS01972.1 hypothetical protein LEP1GSC125_0251 [Leptospira mayottensis 200901122]AXR63538.1 hypothetical protein DQM28_04180 [Leptospira mayottensis]AXR67762.1 hypothetical protein DPV73_06780 [Leptospira mayottensis]
MGILVGLDDEKEDSKVHKPLKGCNLWELLRFVTNLLNDCNWFLLRFWDKLQEDFFLDKGVLAF